MVSLYRIDIQLVSLYQFFFYISLITNVWYHKQCKLIGIKLNIMVISQFLFLILFEFSHFSLKQTCQIFNYQIFLKSFGFIHRFYSTYFLNIFSACIFVIHLFLVSLHLFFYFFKLNIQDFLNFQSFQVKHKNI